MDTKLVVTVAALATFAIWWMLFRWSKRRGRFFYFDPQDYFAEQSRTRPLPKAAEKGTFEPMLKHYLGVTQLLVTVAAASIAFSANIEAHRQFIGIAKLVLACGVFYGVLFCALLLWRYDEYTQNVESYTLCWYATIQAFGFSCLSCFMAGYLLWGFGGAL